MNNMKKETLIIALLCGFFSTAAAQNTLKGRVVDSKGNSVVGAKVENSKNSAENTTTDMNGQFYLTTREPADKVTIRYIGMATKRKKAKQDMTVRMSQLSSQVTWNIKAGAGANFGGDYVTFIGKVGVGPEIHLSDHWSVMPSLEAAHKSFKCEYKVITETTSIIYTQIPILAAYRFRISNSMNMKLKAGPYFALNLYDNHNDFTDAPSIKKVDLGLDAGVDFEIKHFVFGIESEIGLINTASISMINYYSDDYKYKYKNLSLYATVGWRF